MKTLLTLLLSLSFCFAQVNVSNTAKFPSAIPGDRDLPFASNNAETSLTSAMTTNSNSFTVLDPSKFPNKPFFVTIVGPSPQYVNMEIILVCEVRGNQFYVCPNGRKQGNTQPLVHKYGDTVQANLVADHVNQLNVEVRATQNALGASLANVIKTGQTAGGDLTGTYPNPTINTIQGKAVPAGQFVGTTDTQTITNKNVTGSFTGNLTGNASTATTAGSFAANPTDCSTGQYAYQIAANGNLTCKAPLWSELSGTATAGGDLTGSYPDPTVASVGGKTASQIASTVNDVTAGTSANTANALVRRSAGGVIAATTFTGNLSGNASTATQFASSPAQCATGSYSTGITAFGVANCAQVQYSQIGGTVAIPNTAVTPGTYGSDTKSVRIVIGSDGRVTSAQEFTIPGTDTNGLTNMQDISGNTLAARNYIYPENGLVVRDDGSSTNRYAIGLSTTGVSGGTYGSVSSVPVIVVDTRGRITSASNSAIAIAGTQVTSGTISNSRLNASAATIPNNLVLRDNAGSFSAHELSLTGSVTYRPADDLNPNTYSPFSVLNAAGTLATFYVTKGGLVASSGGMVSPTFTGNLVGNANTASAVAWSGVSGKPSIVYADGGTYNASISGNSATSSTASAVPFSGISSLPVSLTSLVSGRVRISNIGCASGYATSCDANANGYSDYADWSAGTNYVDWVNVAGKPTNFVYNDGGTYGINISGSVPWNNISSRPVVPTHGTQQVGRFAAGGAVKTTDYAAASYEAREYNTAGSQTGDLSEAPRYVWHWAGRVAGQAIMNNAGGIELRNQEGSGYINLTAHHIYAAGDIYSNSNPVVTNNGGTYGINISGNAASASSAIFASSAITASSVPWTGITGKPSIAYSDGGTYNLNISGNSATATSATSSETHRGTRTALVTIGDSVNTVPLNKRLLLVGPLFNTPSLSSFACLSDGGVVAAQVVDGNGQSIATMFCNDGSFGGAQSSFTFTGGSIDLTTGIFVKVTGISSGTPKSVSFQFKYRVSVAE